MIVLGKVARRALVVGVSAAVATVGLASSPSQAAPGDGQVRELTGPVLAPDDRGGHLLVARRDIDGTHLQGQVVTSRLAPGARKWTAVRPLSSQKRTVGLALDAAGAGHALAAWTAGGHVYLRSRNARGVWSPETKLSRQSGTRWVDVDVNRAGDQSVAWLQGGHPMLAWRAAGEKSWKRWRGPKSTQRPAADLGERKGGRSTARITWLNGADAATSVRLREISVAGKKKPATTKVLLARAGIKEFGWDAGATRMTLAVTYPRVDSQCGFLYRTLTAFDGPLTGTGLTERFQGNESGYRPDVVATGTSTMVTWSGDGTDSTCTAGAYGFTSSRTARGGTWGAEQVIENRDFSGQAFLSQGLDKSGRGLLAYFDGENGTAVKRPRTGSPYLVQRPALTTVSARGPEHGGPTVSVGSKGRFVAAWTEGPRKHPVLKVRTFSR